MLEKEKENSLNKIDSAKLQKYRNSMDIEHDRFSHHQVAVSENRLLADSGSNFAGKGSKNKHRKNKKKKINIEVDKEIITENVNIQAKNLTPEDISFLKTSFKHHFTLESLSSEEAYA